MAFSASTNTLLLAASLVALPAAADLAANSMDVVSQTQGLPREFEAHFFDVPLAVRVDLDGRYLGDAMVVLSRDGRVQLLEFTDTYDSREPAQLRARWQERLAAGRSLGQCTNHCPDGLQAIHYSLVNSQLSLLTRNVEEQAGLQRYHALPEDGSTGLLLRNQLNLVRDGSGTAGRYAVQGQGSVGNWTTLADANFDRGSDYQAGTRHRLGQFYAERLFDEHFFRLGYFTPSAQGLTRQPRLLGSSPDTTLGLMFGSSDSLRVDNGLPSATPIYVTPNRPGIVEILRNGVLINSQAVEPGLQALDTRVLPGGIYEVEVRLIEDGQETSRSESFVYKPNNWSNPDSRWRYNLYAGQQTSLLSNWDDPYKDSLGAGVLANYLLHPRAVLGLSAQHVDDAMQYGSSLDWDVLDRFKVYGSVFSTDGKGNGYDLQVISNQALGSLVLGHGRTWIDTAESTGSGQVGQVTQSSLSWSQRMNRKSTATLRLSHNSGAVDGLGIDLGWNYYGKLGGSDANWRLSLFDRPASRSTGDARNRGVNLSLSMSLSLGGPGQRVAASLGSRTARDGGRDQNASLKYQQDVDMGAIRSLGATVNVDHYGVGVGGDTQFSNEALFGDAYAQTSSYNGELSGGLNLQSTLAVGGGKVAMSGQYLPHDAGLVIDVSSDIEHLKLRADDVLGMSATLHPGRNVIPVTALRSGSVQFDFADAEDPAAVIQPASLDYHLNRGGVEYRQLSVMRTVTVLGRLLDAQGRPLRGALVINHASRSVTEDSGFFSVEMSESTPTLEIRRDGKVACLLTLDPQQLEREASVLLAGDQMCPALEVVEESSDGVRSNT
ncbi:TcfC E-set like domain-containing protein [Pseudomonas kurunegalensis]|uniref:TcfC E-set like domain-containing protein n=1 Tax=Pseudomonas kurunegalensis TaxID=485880 RepID=UPI0025708280|nr:TcfC E-set like domain-containing protein [Pseudomonas kurunegalensis]WJD63998.1 TcfC E-set like domain-containing protein [Pseudomonas kurunegalensis]